MPSRSLRVNLSRELSEELDDLQKVAWSVDKN
jgi:hypothetical protein